MGIFYEVNTIRIVPQLTMYLIDGDSDGYHTFTIDEEAEHLLSTALHTKSVFNMRP